MITLLNPFFWISFLWFFVAIFLAFFIPGDLLLKRVQLSSFQRVVLGTILGMVLWGWQGWIFGYLSLRWLSYFYLLVVVLLWLKFCIRQYSAQLIRGAFKHIDGLTSLIIFLGVTIQLSAVWFTGVGDSKGLFFCCSNLDDSILHIAITNEIVKHFPPNEPGMFDLVKQNYHYWGNLVVAELIRVFRLPLIATQYQYITVFISLFLGLSAVVFTQLVRLGKSFTYWLIFFLYFGGDSIFLLLAMLGKGVNFTMSSLEDGAKFLVNPPRAFAIVIFFAGLSLLALWIRKKTQYYGILMALLFSVLVGFKIYVGIFALSGLAFLGIYYLLRRDFRMLMPLVWTFFLSLIVYLPVNSTAGGFYFVRFWVFENFIVQPALGLIHLEQAREIFLQHKNWLRVIQYELIYVALFILAIFGTKLVGAIQSRKSLLLLPWELHTLLLGGILVSVFLGFFFQQSVAGGSNTFNFLGSIFIIGSIYSALASFYWIRKINTKLQFVIIFFLIILTIPRVAYEGFTNVKNSIEKNGYLIDNAELNLFRFLREETDKDSLIVVDHRVFLLDKSTPYISFLADRPMFLSGIGNELKAHGIDYTGREKMVNIIFKNNSPVVVGKILLLNKIDYILTSTQPTPFAATESARFLDLVFQNEKGELLRVSRHKIQEFITKENLLGK